MSSCSDDDDSPASDAVSPVVHVVDGVRRDPYGFILPSKEDEDEEMNRTKRVRRDRHRRARYRHVDEGTTTPSSDASTGHQGMGEWWETVAVSSSSSDHDDASGNDDADDTLPITDSHRENVLKTESPSILDFLSVQLDEVTGAAEGRRQRELDRRRALTAAAWTASELEVGMHMNVNLQSKVTGVDHELRGVKQVHSSLGSTSIAGVANSTVLSPQSGKVGVSQSFSQSLQFPVTPRRLLNLWAPFTSPNALRPRRRFVSSRRGLGVVSAMATELEAPAVFDVEWNDAQERALFSLITTHGVSEESRAIIWAELLGINAKMEAAATDYYSDLIETYLRQRQFRRRPTFDDIEKDVQRTFPDCQKYEQNEGRDALRRLLGAYSIRNRGVGYCQSMNYIAATMLMFFSEEQAFWALCCVCEDLCPGYWVRDLAGVTLDLRVFGDMIEIHMPKMATHFEKLGIPVEIVATPWFLCLFLNTIPFRFVLRVWDLLFLCGHTTLFAAGMALLRLNAKDIFRTASLDEFLELSRDIGLKPNKFELFLKLIVETMIRGRGESLRGEIDTLRQRHRPYISDKVQRDRRRGRASANERILRASADRKARMKAHLPRATPTLRRLLESKVLLRPSMEMSLTRLVVPPSAAPLGGIQVGPSALDGALVLQRLHRLSDTVYEMKEILEHTLDDSPISNPPCVAQPMSSQDGTAPPRSIASLRVAVVGAHSVLSMRVVETLARCGIDTLLIIESDVVASMDIDKGFINSEDVGALFSDVIAAKARSIASSTTIVKSRCYSPSIPRNFRWLLRDLRGRASDGRGTPSSRFQSRWGVEHDVGSGGDVDDSDNGLLHSTDDATTTKTVDVVIVCSNNPAVKVALNSVCLSDTVEDSIPWLDCTDTTERGVGSVSVIVPGRTACWECVGLLMRDFTHLASDGTTDEMNGGGVGEEDSVSVSTVTNRAVIDVQSGLSCAAVYALAGHVTSLALRVATVPSTVVSHPFIHLNFPLVDGVDVIQRFPSPPDPACASLHCRSLQASL